MFGNLNWTNVAILLLLALFIFGDRLPQLIGDALRLLRNLRRMATSATSDLSRELGTEIRVEDLNPRTFVRKHILSEADQEKLLKPLKGVSDEVVQEAKGFEQDVRDVGRDAGRATSGAKDGVREAAGLRSTRLTRRGQRVESGSGSRAAPGTPRSAAPEPAPAAAADPAPPAPAASPSSSYDELI